MDSTDLQQPADEPRRRSPLAVLAAGSLAGLVLGFGGMAFAADPAPSTGTGVEQAATTEEGTTEEGTADEDAAEGSAADDLCDEPGGGAGTDDTADDAADAEASSTSA